MEFDDNDAREAWDASRAANLGLVSPSTSGEQQGPGLEFLAQDPDRHVIVFHCTKPNANSRITSPAQRR